MIGAPGKIGLAACAMSIVASAYLLTTPRIPADFGASASRVQDAISRMPIDEQALEDIGRIQPRLAFLDTPPPPHTGTPNIAVLGYQEITPLPPPPEPEPEPEPVVVIPLPEPEPFEYTVSMTYVSPDRRFAVVDGRFYREGATMQGGEVLLAISPSAVQIQRHDMTRWVEIRRERENLIENGGIIEADATGLNSGSALPSGAIPSNQVRHES